MRPGASVPELILRPRARQDLEAIWRYSAERWSPARADIYLRDLDTVMRALLHHRLRGYAIDDVRPGYRAIRAASHLLVYRLVGDVVEIVRVLHRSMDLKAQI